MLFFRRGLGTRYQACFAVGALALSIGACDATGLDESEAAAIPISEFTAANFWGVPIGGGQVELTYFANTDYYPLTPSVEVYPLRGSSVSVTRVAGDSLALSGWVRAEGTPSCQIQFGGTFHHSALDGRVLPTDMTTGPAGVLQFSTTCTRPDTYWGISWGTTTYTLQSIRANFVPTADSAGRLSLEFEEAGVVRFSPDVPDTALTFRVSGRGEFERRRNGALYVDGAYVRGGPGSTSGGGTTTPTDPNVPLPPGSVTCPNPPTGYVCITRSGSQATPFKLRPDGVLRTWYHSESFRTCIGLGAQEPTAYAAYRSGPGYGGAPLTGLNYWGAPVSSDGVITGTADGRYIYIYTGHPDPQVALLLYDLQLKNFATMGFQRVSSCPY